MILLKLSLILRSPGCPLGLFRIGLAAEAAAPIESIYDGEPFIFYVRFSHDVPTTPYGCAAGFKGLRHCRQRSFGGEVEADGAKA